MVVDRATWGPILWPVLAVKLSSGKCSDFAFECNMLCLQDAVCKLVHILVLLLQPSRVVWAQADPV